MKTRVIYLFLLVFAGCGGSETAGPSPVLVASPTAPASNMPATSAAIAAPSPELSPALSPEQPTRLPTAELSSTHAPSPVSSPAVQYSYPIGMPGRPLGDGFFVRHGYVTENTWFQPGSWHTGEDWYALEGDAAGARVYAVADGEVVFAGANYPGRVVIIRHTGGLFSMYGHLEPGLDVEQGQQVARGDPLGTVLRRADAVPNHLHFEMRTFLTNPEVNGDTPRYRFSCGVRCPPGPGYWPITAPEHPSALGWRNPTHGIARRMFASEPAGEVVVATQPASSSLVLWSTPPTGSEPGRRLGELSLRSGERFQLLDVRAGEAASQGSSAQSYLLWYRIGLADRSSGWVQVAVASERETGSDGRPSSVLFNIFPLVPAGP